MSSLFCDIVPKKILSDRRSQFSLQFIKDLYKVLGTKRTLLIVYYSQTDDQIERIN